MMTWTQMMGLIATSGTDPTRHVGAGQPRQGHPSALAHQRVCRVHNQSTGRPQEGGAQEGGAQHIANYKAHSSPRLTW
jgi:hypothetical protein